MATITSFAAGKGATQHIGGFTVINENVLDFAVTPVKSGDVVQAMKIPKNAILKDVRIEVLTVEGGAATINVGDLTDPDGIDVAVDVNSAAGIIKADGAYMAAGKRYAATSTIDVILLPISMPPRY